LICVYRRHPSVQPGAFGIGRPTAKTSLMLIIGGWSSRCRSSSFQTSPSQSAPGGEVRSRRLGAREPASSAIAPAASPPVRRTRSLAGMPRSGWVVAPFGLTRGWPRSPQSPHSHLIALPSVYRPRSTARTLGAHRGNQQGWQGSGAEKSRNLIFSRMKPVHSQDGPCAIYGGTVL
jgi:hypothetical protein